MKYIITLIFIFLISSFNFPINIEMKIKETSMSSMETATSCHDAISTSIEESCQSGTICQMDKTDCSSQCLTKCSQTASFIFTKMNDLQKNNLSTVKIETLSQLYQSMKISNLFRPPIV